MHRLARLSALLAVLCIAGLSISAAGASASRLTYSKCANGWSTINPLGDYVQAWSLCINPAPTPQYPDRYSLSMSAYATATDKMLACEGRISVWGTRRIANFVGNFGTVNGKNCRRDIWKIIYFPVGSGTVTVYGNTWGQFSFWGGAPYSFGSWDNPGGGGTAVVSHTF